MAGLGEDIKVYGENYADATALPKNTTSYTDSREFGAGGQNGSINCKGVVNEKIVIADTKTLTIKLQESDDDESFDDVVTVHSITASGEAYSVPVGTVLFNEVLPTDIKKHTRFSLTTTDAAAAGKVDIYPQYLPR